MAALGISLEAASLQPPGKLAGEGESLNADEVVCALCRGLFDPELELGNLTSVNTTLVVVNAGTAALKELFFGDAPGFLRLEVEVQVRLLDVLIHALRGNVYNVVRFCCDCADAQELDDGDGGVLQRLLDLLPAVEHRPAVACRVVGLVGVIGTAGIKARDLKRILTLLRRPPAWLAHSVLDALRSIARQDVLVAKASPTSFFNFGGRGSGIMASRMCWPFPSGYQLATWFRIERFPFASQRAHIFTFLTKDGRGVDLYFSAEGKLCLTIADYRTSGTPVSETIEISGVDLHTRVWYFIDVEHTRSRLSFLGKDTLSVHIDHRAVYRGHPRYPKNIGVFEADGPAAELTYCSVGDGFDGQMAPVYLFVEPVSQAVIHTLASYHASNEKSAALDLEPGPLGMTARAFSSRLLLVYHPDRCCKRMCLDLHNGRHGMLARSSRVWTLEVARDVVASIGGVAVLFPLMFIALIADGEAHGDGDGDGDGAGGVGLPSQGGVRSGCLSMLLSILARMLRAHEINQRELYRIGGLEMLEYIISQTPARVFQGEDVGDCVRAVLELCNCSAGAGYPALETQMIRRLLNPLLWRRAPVEFQLQLLQTQIGYVRSSLAAAREILSVASILDTIRALYTHDQGTERQAQADERERGGEGEGEAAGGADASGSGEEYRARSLIRVFRTSSFSHISSNDEFLALTRGGGEVTASRKDKEMLRTTALQIIICLCQEGVTEKDLRPLLEFLACFTEREVDLAEEVLQLLLYWLQQPVDGAPPPGLLDTIRDFFPSSQAFAAFLILGVVNREADQLRATGIRVLSAYLIMEDAARLGLSGDSPLGSPTSASSGSSSTGHRHRGGVGGPRSPLDRFLVSSGGAFLWHYLQQHLHTVDEHTYAALLEMALAHRGNLGTLPLFTKPSAGTSRFLPSSLQPTKMLDDVDEIHNVTVLTILLRLLPALPVTLRQRAYNDLLLLLKFSEQNRSTFVSMRGWQLRLFELLSPLIVAANEAVAATEEGQRESGGLLYQPGLTVASLLRPTASFRDDGLDREGVGVGLRQSSCSSTVQGPDRWVEMVLRLYTLLLQHALSAHPQGWQELGSTASLEAHCPLPQPFPRDSEEDESPGRGPPSRLSLLALSSHLLGEVHGLLKAHSSQGSAMAMASEVPYLPNLQHAAFVLTHLLFRPGSWSVITLSIQSLHVRPPDAAAPPAPPRPDPPPRPPGGPTAEEANDDEVTRLTCDGPSPSPQPRPESRGGGSRPSSRQRVDRSASPSPSSPTPGSCWSEQCDGSGRTVLFGLGCASSVHGHRLAEQPATVLVAMQLLQVLDTLLYFRAQSTSLPFASLKQIASHAVAAPAADPSAPISSVAETQKALAFLQEEGPLPSCGTVGALTLKLSLFVLHTVHPLHPLALVNTWRLRRLARLLCCLPSSKTLDSWLVLLVVHVQSALRRLRDMVVATITPEAETQELEQGNPAPSPANANAECAFCVGELQGVVTQIEDLFETLDTLNRFRPALIAAAMDSDSSTYASFSSMLQARKMAYNRHNRRRASEPLVMQKEHAEADVKSDDRPTPLASSSAERHRSQSAAADGVRASLACCRSCLLPSSVGPSEASGDGEVGHVLPWKLHWLLSAWLDSPLAPGQARVREAAAHLVGEEEKEAREQDEFAASCFETQRSEDKAWRISESVRSAMYMEGRRIKCSLEEADHQRAAVRAATMELQQRAAVAKWGTLLRTLSAEWSPWAVEDEQSRWKISTHADGFRRRMLLSRADKFDDHQDAAYRSGKGSASDDEDQDSDGGGGEAAEGKQHDRDRDDTADVLLKSRLIPVHDPRAGPTQTQTHGEGDDGQRTLTPTPSATAAVPPSPSEQRSSSRGSTRLGRDSAASRSTTPAPDSPTKDTQGRPAWADAFAEGEHWVTSQVGKMVNPHGSISGVAILTNRHLYFHPDRNVPANDQFRGRGSYIWKDKKWRLDRITEVHGRRHLLRSCALEFYFTDAHEVFLAFHTSKERASFYGKLTRQRTPLLVTPRSLKPAEVLKESKYTEMWRRRQISNFEYLMRLNIIAGRSYNDINQYPVFPWVLSNYTSSELDLNDPANYRDLSKPVGALNPQRLAVYKERYEAFEDEVVPKFLYGSHYSTAGLVLHFLMRQEPFATLAIKLQSGTFDNPNRLFFDLHSSWRGCQASTSDVKELVPELFCMPEILLNTNAFPLGRLDDGSGQAVGDVRLPPWAKNAFDFVRLHRLALESEVVSQHLHEWIDLVFGFKQRGEAAVTADNVFYYLTYEGAVDIEAINDPMLRDATEAQIKHYGQTPSQLLTKPHPPRLPREECVLTLCHSVAALKDLRAYTPSHQLTASQSALYGESPPVLSTVVQSERLVVVFADLTVALYRWSSMPDIHDFPFTVRPERARQLPCHAVSMSSYAISSFDPTPLLQAHQSGPTVEAPQSPSTATAAKDEQLRSLGQWNFAVGGERVMCCGFWDHSVKCYGLDNGFKLQANTCGGHRGAINCLQLGEDNVTLVTGGQDGTCRVWVADSGCVAAALMTDCAYLGSRSDDASASSAASPSSTHPSSAEPHGLQCVAILWGHETPVICVSLSTHLDLLASGSVGGTIVIHQVRKGKYVRRIVYPSTASHPPPVNMLHLVQQTGDLIAHSWQDCSLHTFSFNGFPLASTRVRHPLYAMAASKDGQMLVSGGASGVMSIHLVHSLELVHEMTIGHGPIRSLSFTPDHQYILIGSQDGQFTVVADPLGRLQMLHRVLSRTFLGAL